MSLRLAIFDIDGTLVDSQATIVACMQAAFRAEGLPPPAPEAVRRIVGLTLPIATAELLGEPDPDRAERLAEHYKAAFFAMRARPDFEEPLFPGARATLDRLLAEGWLLGVATGKAMRGLRAVLERHGLERHFTTLQTADLHPSKPHPAMIEAALCETGAPREATLMIGDTSFDMAMAKAARVVPIGVAWGNHPAEELVAAGAERILDRFEALFDDAAGPADGAAVIGSPRSPIRTERTA
ncbi:MAG: HAD-IA family hydrolase [Geminicoccaceae bacterium]|nr:HAD-IA family hydrolase [Geminicoccaceae bacterium]MCX8100207.1 HAD-IA family hydrolase [Geminicoccaceae bacterium]MDW8371074.1 HAD-IA family hydrolase [Geminicoccaceae bacterium]